MKDRATAEEALNELNRVCEFVFLKLHLMVVDCVE
jgi:hypothetical protein